MPLPGDGTQAVSLTHCADVASMLASVPGNAQALGQVYNCGTDAEVTYNELVGLVAAACGKEVRIVDGFGTLKRRRPSLCVFVGGFRQYPRRNARGASGWRVTLVGLPRTRHPR